MQREQVIPARDAVAGFPSGYCGLADPEEMGKVSLCEPEFFATRLDDVWQFRQGMRDGAFSAPLISDHLPTI